MTTHRLPDSSAAVSCRSLLALAGIAVSLIVVNGAFAADSAYRLQLTIDGQSAALGARTVPLLEVVPPAGGRDAQLERLMAFLALSPDRRIQPPAAPLVARSSKRSSLIGTFDGTSYVEVLGDGSKWRFHSNLDDPAEIAAEASLPRLELPALEALGRDYITRQLAPLAPLAPGETLVFLGSRYLQHGSSDAVSPVTESVVANVAVFAREVQGTFVGGGGSKLAVWFNKRSEPVGFDADWPSYLPAVQRQATLPIGLVMDRVAAYSDNDLLLIQRNTRRFECGYVDLGVFKRGLSLLQAGCFVHHEGSLTDPDFGYASVEVIPIGVDVLPDPSWPVTRFVAAGLPWDPCSASPKACRSPASPREPRSTP